MQVASASGCVRHQSVRSRQQLVKVSVLASAFLLAVVLGNVSLRYIPVSFAQVSLPCLFLARMSLQVRAHLRQALKSGRGKAA